MENTYAVTTTTSNRNDIQQTLLSSAMKNT